MFFDPRDKPAQPGWRQRFYVVLFETERSDAQAFDIVLLLAIAASVLVAMLETVRDVAASYGDLLAAAEWVLTIAFTVEYLLRVAVMRRPWRFILSPLGLIDLASVLPSYVGLLLHGDPFSLQLLRVLRLFRAFRVLHLGPFVQAGHQLRVALAASRPKIVVFTAAVVILALVQGTLIYYIEGGGDSEVFTSIPRSVYWAVVTMTTVGYGDMVPQTVAGKFVSTLLMLIGYGIIAVPTGIVTAELTRRGIEEEAHHSAGPDSAGPANQAGPTQHRNSGGHAEAQGVAQPEPARISGGPVPGHQASSQGSPSKLVGPARECPACAAIERHPDANFCRYCGEELPGLPDAASGAIAEGPAQPAGSAGGPAEPSS